MSEVETLVGALRAALGDPVSGEEADAAEVANLKIVLREGSVGTVGRKVLEVYEGAIGGEKPNFAVALAAAKYLREIAEGIERG